MPAAAPSTEVLNENCLYIFQNHLIHLQSSPTLRFSLIAAHQSWCFHSEMFSDGYKIIFSAHHRPSFLSILFSSYHFPCCLFPYCFSIISPSFWDHSVHKLYSIFSLPPLIKVNERVVVPMNFACNMQPRSDETHRNNSALFFQLGTTLLWLITFLLVQKLDRRLLSADIRFTYLSNSDLWNREMKQHKCKAISQPDLQRYEMH